MRSNKSPKTMDDIARLAGVSKPTVSRALQDSPLVNAKTKEKVLEVAQRYGYAANRNAQNLRRKRNNTIALAIDYPSLPEHRINDPFHFELLANVSNALAARDQDLLLCSPRSSTGYETILASKGADGLLIFGQVGRKDALRRMAKFGVPFVVWGTPDPEGGYSVVSSDNIGGGRLAARRFMELGRRRVAFMGPPDHPEIAARREGLVAGLSESGSRLLLDIHPADFSYDAALAAARQVLKSSAETPDAIFCGSDTFAIGTLAALREAGVDVPSSCSVIGYDDGPAAILHTPQLTTVRQDTRMAGAVLVETLMQVIDGARPRPKLLPVELIVRAT